MSDLMDSLSEYTPRQGIVGHFWTNIDFPRGHYWTLSKLVHICQVMSKILIYDQNIWKIVSYIYSKPKMSKNSFLDFWKIRLSCFLVIFNGLINMVNPKTINASAMIICGRALPGVISLIKGILMFVFIIVIPANIRMAPIMVLPDNPMAVMYYVTEIWPLFFDNQEQNSLWTSQ